jgi:ATP-binding cassette subfamily B protein
VIVISHRISAVRDADVILVLDEGHIVETGTHVSLVERGGVYTDIFQQQALEEELAEL